MALSALIVKFSDLRKRSRPDACAPAEPQEERKPMTVPQPRPRRRKPLDAGPFAPEIGSFRLHLAAEGKAAKTVRTYTEAVAWFAAAHLIPRTSHARWEQVSGHDVQRWMVHLLTRYSDAYASNQFRALQQFFRWLAEEEQLPDPMARLRAPKVTEKLVPVFTSEELSRAGARPARAARSPSGVTPRSSRCSRRPGSALAELAGIRYDPHDPRRSDVDLWRREITVRGKGGKAADGPDRPRGRPGPGPVPPRPRQACAGAPAAAVAGGEQPGADDRERDLPDDRPPRPAVRRGCLDPHRFRHHFSHTWLDRGGAEGDLMELNGWSSPQMLRRYGASARSARARRTYDRIMTDRP